MAPDSTPSLAAIHAARRDLAPYLRQTPILAWDDPWMMPRFPAGCRPVLKLELLQVSGSFKARGALTAMLHLPADALARGVTAVSAGNHAIAVAYGASVTRTSAVVVMPRTANPARVELCRTFGATVRLMHDVAEAFAEVERLQREEGRTLVHPFEGADTILGTATLGDEWLDQVDGLDAVIVPIGGGGLAAGVAAAVKQRRPACRVFGVEPTGNDVMTRSFHAGEPVKAVDGARTIADSLAPPFALPMSYGLCRRFLDDIVLVDDDALCTSLYWLFRSAKLAVEPAAAAATAALLGPLRDRLAGARAGVLVCGANIDAGGFATCLARGAALANHRPSPAGVTP